MKRPARALALRRTAPTPAEPNGLWQADSERYSTADLLGILDAEPERISPAALLRPVFQDFLFGTSAQHRRPGGDRLPGAVRGSLRAHPRPPDTAHRALLRHAHRAAGRRAAPQARAHARAGLRRRKRNLARPAPGRPLDAHRNQATAGCRRQRPRRRARRARRLDAIAGQGTGPVGRDRGRQDALPDEPPAHAGRQLPVAARSHAHAPRRRPLPAPFIPAACCRSASTARRTTSPATVWNWPKRSAPKPRAPAPATRRCGCEAQGSRVNKGTRDVEALGRCGRTQRRGSFWREALRLFAGSRPRSLNPDPCLYNPREPRRGFP